MDLLALVAVLISAAMHAGWNLIAKSEAASAAFFVVAMLASTLAIAPVFLYYASAIALLTPSIWLLLIATGFFTAMNYIAVAQAYRLHDISFVYPLARALPVLMVTLISLAIGYGKPLSSLAFIGLFITALGCLVLPLQKLSWAFLKQYLHRSIIFVVAAAIGTTGYTIVDSMGVEQVRKAVPHFSAIDAPIFYIAYQTLFTLFFLIPYVVLSKNERHHFKILTQRSLRYPIWAGIILKLSYVLILFSMQFATNVSYIVGFRQSSILFSFALGLLFLREKTTVFKNVGVALIFVGLVLATVAR